MAHLGSFEVYEYVVVLVDRVGIGMRGLASTLEVLAAHQATVDVLIGH